MSIDTAVVRARVGEAIQAYQGAVDDFDREVARLMGVNETDLRCLEILLGVETATPSWLGARLGLTSGSVTTMLDRLEKLDYLTRAPHETDRRKIVVRITAHATEHAYALLGPFLEDSEKVLDRYTPEQLTLITDFLTTNRENQEAHVRRLRDASNS